MKKSILIFLMIFLAACSEPNLEKPTITSVVYDRNQTTVDMIQWVDQPVSYTHLTLPTTPYV